MSEVDRGTRALVLGGGGVTGIAWELGVIAALLEHGIDVSRADLIVGTSAGSTVAAQITSGTTIEDLVAAQQTPADQCGEISVDLDLDAMISIFSVLNDRSLPGDERRARVGAMALDAETIEEGVRWDVIAARLPVHDWPDHPMVLTAVDAHSGAFVAFDKSSGLSLVDAVAASCAVPGVWPPVTTAGSRFIDGGVRSSTNVDLARDHASVLVLSPLTRAMTTRLDHELGVLDGAGAEVVLVIADDEAQAAMGSNPLDASMRAPALAAGKRQGAAVAPEVERRWVE